MCPALAELVAATLPAIDALRSFTAKIALVLYQARTSTQLGLCGGLQWGLCRKPDACGDPAMCRMQGTGSAFASLLHKQCGARLVPQPA